jgi:ABC-type multidrug transport system ATPase subunit
MGQKGPALPHARSPDPEDPGPGGRHGFGFPGKPTVGLRQDLQSVFKMPDKPLEIDGRGAASLPEEQVRPPSPALVKINEVTKTFGPKIALQNVSFTVPSGQICGLLGPNGAGKTTLFRLLMGILKATEGKLSIDGFDAFEDRVTVKRLIGFLPDEPVFYSYLSGREVLELSAAMHGLEPRVAMGRLAPIIAKLRLAEDINNYAEDYSRGMKKKLGLLLAMLHGPKLLVLDEPTNGLDVESTHLFYDLIFETAEQGTTVLFSTHLMDHVTKLCSHAVIMNEGTIVAKGSLDELCAAFGQASLEDVFLKLTARAPQK